MFTEKFNTYVCAGDTIETVKDGIRYVATIYYDDSSQTPDGDDEGFWPSLDPKSPGYIGPKSKATLARHMARAKAIVESFMGNEWFYCGVAVRAYIDDTPLTGEYDFALWGVECNYPTFNKKTIKNAYLLEVANELLNGCEEQAHERLVQLVEAGQTALTANKEA